ncbi:nitronate monooxygenase [Pseudomaricurvus alkylphenolicus]|jgi:NAD(P)H-dependent flavin oxidoreductase YrpB (nitropropane dioxygenase family)|uniref:nitronate monooxygenase n=1 Tax=Pseudomaricurvus alkylphenolicus TaxID=1306991 RepID=UPI00141E1E3E|nr:nitronate monooxygenase family protein [Pseudomaricurvus alkylphenolicus]NIB42141.1 nitronate monooxygenase [Pseudomaricurvus alkylphenolicus]
MQTELCKRLGIDLPIFAFTHCRDVVVAVSRAGGIGVLGAVGMTNEKLQRELDWIDEHIGDYPYGVDVVIPQKYEGQGELDADKLEAKLKAMVPPQHREFADKLLSDHGVPPMPDEEETRLLGWNEAIASTSVDIALRHPKCRLIANALGTPPAHIVQQIQDSGRLVGALCGRIKQVKAHRDAGLDFIVAQGGEGGGHTGDVGSIVLWPQAVEAAGDIPVLAAGGIASGQQMLAAMATGVQGVWTGSLWLAVEEAHAQPAQKQSYFDATSEDTVRSRAWTGKPCRVLRNHWSDAWELEDTPSPLGMPLQGLVTNDAMKRTGHYAGVSRTQEVAFNPVGQVVGQINAVESCRSLITRLLNEYLGAQERLNQLLEQAQG